MQIYFDYFYVNNNIFHKNIGGVKKPFTQSMKYSIVNLHQIYCNSSVGNLSTILSQNPKCYCPPGCSLADAVPSSFPG